MKRFKIFTVAAALFLAGTAFSARRSHNNWRNSPNNPRNYVYAQTPVEQNFLLKVANRDMQGGSLKAIKQRLKRAKRNNPRRLAKLLTMRNFSGKNALHLAAKNGRPQLIRFLLNNFPRIMRVNVKALNGNTALHLAAKHGKPGAVYALLNCGARPGILNNARFTALQVAQNHRRTAAAQKIRNYTWRMAYPGRR